MAFLNEKGTFTKRTDTGTDVISHSLGESPDILIFWTTAQTSTGLDANDIYGIGFSDGTRHKAVCSVSENAQTMSDTGRIARTNKCIVILAPNGGLEAEADISAVSSTTFTVNWTTNGGGADIIHYQIFAGSDITTSEVNHFVANTSTGNQVVSHINSPTDGYDIYMFIYCRKDDANEGNSAGLGIGFATDASNEAALWGNSENNRGTADTWRRQSDARCITQLLPGSGAADAAASFNAKATANFTINWGDAPANADFIMYMGIKGGQHHVGMLTEPGGTGTQDITAPGFQAVGYMLASFCRTEILTLQSHNQISFGGTDGTNEGVLTGRDQDAVGTTNADTRSSTAAVFINLGDTVDTITDEADHNAFLTTGFQLNWSNIGTANWLFYWAFGDDAAGGESIVKNVTLENVNIAETDPVTNFILGRIRNINETVEVNEATPIDHPLIQVRVIPTENIELSEAIDRIRIMVRNITTENIDIGEVSNRLGGLTRNVTTENIEISEVSPVQAVLGLVKNVILETIEIGEVAAQSILGLVKNVITETIELSEVKDRIRIMVRNVTTENVNISEALDRVRTLIRNVTTENVNIGETLNRLGNQVRNITTENINISEVKDRIRTLVRTVTLENVNIGEVLNRIITAGGNPIRVINESVNISEASQRIGGVLSAGAKIFMKVARQVAKKPKDLVSLIDKGEFTTIIKVTADTVRLVRIRISVATLFKKILTTSAETLFKRSARIDADTLTKNVLKLDADTLIKNEVKLSAKTTKPAKDEIIGKKKKRTYERVKYFLDFLDRL